ncbi:lipopolysaccharide biosynthesis protein [Kocuria rosea]|uniref:lipopolysaccharide biosynthesis protein n=1 Tax=Kocuria rosea TaxID=1275 RepID=UPI001386FBBD|nr:lipopolysaccharide biosynthesis protein [Kocuria rosea]MEB2528887.1 lipopolysaccharide biosynthesis protein [Kocuria rosea]MEB2618792.1 lipopolysaccharide biosynthesis protein [Kocuria rosea]
MDPPVSAVAEETSRSLAQSSVRGFLWSTLAWGSNRIIILGLTLVLARLLAPQDFGLVTAALTIITMLDAALDLGVGASVVADQERGITRRIRTAFTLNVTISAAIAATGVALSPLIAAVFDSSRHAGLFALIFLYPLLRGAGQVNDAVLKRDLRFRRRTVIDLLRALVRVGVSIPLALTVGGAMSIAAGIIVSELLAMLLLWILVPIKPAFRLARADISHLLRFGGLVTVIRILGSFRGAFDYFIVGSLISTTALGFYGMAYKLPELIIENVLWIVSAVALSAYSRARTVGHDVLLGAMIRATRLLSLYGLAAGTVLAVVARDAVPVLFSPQWSDAIVPMMLISLSLGVMSISWGSGDVFLALGRSGTLIKLELPATALMITAFLFSAQYGLIGVASVHLIFNILHCTARMILVRHITRVTGRSLLSAIAPAVLVSMTTAVVGFGTSTLLPRAELSSLLILSTVCAVTVVGTAMLFARPAVLEVIDMVGLHQKRSATIPADPGPA